jgi:uncharacterized repeat protein (TIGR04138 family)
VIDQDQIIRDICRVDPRYARACYYFVSDALAYTVQRMRERQRHRADVEPEPEIGEACHVSGQELLEGVRDLAWERFGPLARVVFQQWGVRSTLDFGRIVFNLIEADLMSKQESDTLEDFRGGFDIETAFNRDLDIRIED